MILGFSTAAMTGNVFKLICTMKDLDPHLTIGIGAQGGMDINAMLDEGSGYWRKAILDLSNVGLSNAQIQLIWISTGDMQSASLEFPKQSIALADKYHTLLLMIKQKYPNIKIVFLSDRTFAGYIDNNGPQLLAEPTAYYTSWAVKFLIERQLQSLTDYTYSDIPFIDWGPMLWTNGETGDSYNYKWDCDDAAKGGIHPTAKGRSKEAIRLYNFSVIIHIQNNGLLLHKAKRINKFPSHFNGIIKGGICCYKLNSVCFCIVFKKTIKCFCDKRGKTVITRKADIPFSSNFSFASFKTSTLYLLQVSTVIFNIISA